MNEKKFRILSQKQFCLNWTKVCLMAQVSDAWKSSHLNYVANIVFFYLRRTYSTNDNSEAAGGTRGGAIVCDQNLWVAYLDPHWGGLYLFEQWRQASLCIRWYRFVVGEVCRLRSACIHSIIQWWGCGARSAHSKSVFSGFIPVWFIPAQNA